MAVTLADARTYLGVDYVDAVTDANITRALAAAEKTLQGAVGEDVRTLMTTDARVDQLVLIYTDDLFSERGVTSAKVSNATRRLVQDMELQLRLELRELREAATT